MKRAALIAVVVASVASSVPARASPDCKSLAEARAAYPGTHLWWHHAGAARCWDDNGAARRAVRHRPAAPPPETDKTPMILYPTLVEGAGVEPQMLAAETVTNWPLILDIDEVTADPPAPDLNDCCWPPLDEPRVAFSERWYAMPSTWFTAGGTRP